MKIEEDVYMITWKNMDTLGTLKLRISCQSVHVFPSDHADFLPVIIIIGFISLNSILQQGGGKFKEKCKIIPL